MSDRELFWAVWHAQFKGQSLEDFLKAARQMWIEQREEQLHRERREVEAR